MQKEIQFQPVFVLVKDTIPLDGTSVEYLNMSKDWILCVCVSSNTLFTVFDS